VGDQGGGGVQVRAVGDDLAGLVDVVGAVGDAVAVVHAGAGVAGRGDAGLGGVEGVVRRVGQGVEAGGEVLHGLDAVGVELVGRRSQEVRAVVRGRVENESGGEILAGRSVKSGREDAGVDGIEGAGNVVDPRRGLDVGHGREAGVGIGAGLAGGPAPTA